jgi:hypothetical protein
MTNAPELYEILVKGHISENLGKQFEGCSVHGQPDGTTIISGFLDQSALHGALLKIRNLGLGLIAVNQIGEHK